MDGLDEIIKEGTFINEGQIVPTINERLNLKVSILSILAEMSQDIFVMNRKLFYWNKRLIENDITLPQTVEQLSNDEFTDKLADWLLDPLLIFCNNPEEVAKVIADKLHSKKYKYVRARNDMYPSRLIIDVEFDIAAILNPTNKTISKHAKNLELYGANINFNPTLILPIILYDYMTPKFNYEQWKDDLLIEPFLWEEMTESWEKCIMPMSVKSIENKEVSSNRIFDLIKTENENDYILTGFFTYLMLTNPSVPYTGEYHIYHKNPMQFLKKVNDEFTGIELMMKEDEKIYYFQSKQYVIHLNGEIILTIYELDFPINFIKLGLYNHVNYHGLLLFLLMDALKSPLKEYEEKCCYIGYLIKTKNIFLKTVGLDSLLDNKGNSGVKNIFEVLQNNSIGPNTTPFLDFKKKEFNKELTFFYKPESKVEPV